MHAPLNKIFFTFQSNTNVNDIPNEVLMRIIAFASANSDSAMRQCRLVNRRWRDIVDDTAFVPLRDEIWREGNNKYYNTMFVHVRMHIILIFTSSSYVSAAYSVVSQIIIVNLICELIVQ